MKRLKQFLRKWLEIEPMKDRPILVPCSTCLGTGIEYDYAKRSIGDKFNTPCHACGGNGQIVSFL